MPAGDRSTPKKAAFLNCEERQLMRNAPFPSCNTTLTTFFAREFRLLTSAVGTSLFMQSSMLSFLSKPGNGAEENHEGRSITIHYISSPFSLSGTEMLPGRIRLPMFSFRIHCRYILNAEYAKLLYCPSAHTYIGILSFHVKHTPPRY